LRGARSRVKLTLGEDEGIVLLDDEIINPGTVRQAWPAHNRPLSASLLSLQLDNRASQFSLGGLYDLFGSGDWPDLAVRLYHGFELPDESVDWLLIYYGSLVELRQLEHGEGLQHNATLQAQDFVHEKLKTLIGTPDADGKRRPFMHGIYMQGSELEDTEEPEITEPEKDGTGSATLHLYKPENYTGNEDVEYLVQAQSQGRINVVLFRWSRDKGQTWSGEDYYTYGFYAPVHLENQVRIYWRGGADHHFEEGDYWTFTAKAKRLKYFLPGAPFLAVTGVYLNDELLLTGFELDKEEGYVKLLGISGVVTARVVKDVITNPVDVIADILDHIGLGPWQDSARFAQARYDLMDFYFGVSFENVTAAAAIQQICAMALIDFWIEVDKIALQVYLGEEA